MKSIIFTSFFSAHKHPQNNDPHVVGIKSDGTVGTDFQYIEKFYNSIVALSLDCRIFYDNLSEETVRKYTTDKVKFVKVPDFEWSNNDARFFFFEDYLEDLEGFDYVFTSDGSDVVVKKDPSELFAQYPDKKFFICRDSINTIEFPYLSFHIQFKLPNYEKFYDEHTTKPLINMGVIGGRIADMKIFLNKLTTLRRSLGSPQMNLDMFTGQFVFRNYWKDSDLLIGSPVTSDFKRYQVRRDDVYFVHK